MTIHFGEVPAGSVLPIHFASYNGSGASVALSGLAITDVEIYKGITVTQRSSDAGIALIDTDGIDIDGIVGANGVSIDLGDNTDAGFYAVGSFYTVWVSSVTIDGQTVNFIAATFRIKEKLSVWDETAANHQSSGSFGLTLGDEDGTGSSVWAIVDSHTALLAALPSAAANATELFDQAAGVETGLTLRQWCRLVGASTAGKLSGAGTGTETIRNAVADSKNRLIATVDASGNRSAITYDLT